VSSIGTENRRKSRKAGVPDRIKPNRQRPPALESAVLPRLSEPPSPRPYLALITKRQGHSGRSTTSKNPANMLVQAPCAAFLFHCYSRPEGLQLISIICDTRYLRHPRLSDGSRGGVRILVGPRGGPKRFLRHMWPDTPSLRELVASTAPLGSQDPRSKPRLRARPRRRPGHDNGARATCCLIWRVGDIIWHS